MNEITEQMQRKIKAGQRILDVIQAHQYEGYFVGGFVRDILLQRFFQLDDIDIATNMPMDQLRGLFVVVYEAKKYGMLCLENEGFSFEVTQFRTDGVYFDGRRPSHITYAQTLQEDVIRRDFTINGLAMDQSLHVYDYIDGMADLERRIIRTIGDPDERFKEDRLRIIRALRFASNLNFEIETQTKAAMLEQKPSIQTLPFERILLELDKVVDFPRFLTLIRLYNFIDSHMLFQGLSHVDASYDTVITSRSLFYFFQIYTSEDRKRTYADLRIGKSERRKYQTLCTQIETYRRFGQTKWWNYQLDGNIEVFKYLALLYKKPYNEYRECYENQSIVSWTQIDFQIDQLVEILPSMRQSVKETIAHDVVQGKVENDLKKIRKHVEEVYGWR